MTRVRPVLAPLALLLALLGSALGLGTPAGTEISNVASAQYVAPGSVLPGTAVSNTVRSVVQAVCAPSLTPDGTAAVPARRVALASGQGGVIAYTLTNAGNALHRLSLAARLEPGSPLAPTLRVVRDLDADGVLDDGEPEVAFLDLAADASAALLLVSGPVSGPGEAWVNLVAACPGGETDGGNVSALLVGVPPTLSLDKTFDPARVRPGQETTVRVTARNGGAVPAGAVVLEDLLDALAAQGLRFVPGSAGGGALEYSVDGVNWSAAESASVRALRLRAPDLAPGEALTLSFRMVAGPEADGQTLTNTATLGAVAASASASALLNVAYAPAVALGPPGTPEVPELGDADRQRRALAAGGSTVCFDHTLKNTGDVGDAYTLEVRLVSGAAAVTVQGASGAPLAQPVALGPGASIPVRVCYAGLSGAVLDALITASGARGPTNATRDEIARIEGALPELLKSAVAEGQNADGSWSALPGGAAVSVGDRLTYTLEVTNPSAQPLPEVAVQDAVPAALDVLGVSDGGVVTGAAGAQTARWALGTLAPGERRSVQVRTVVSGRAADGLKLSNVFTLLAAGGDLGPLTSNEVLTPVWTTRLTVSKAVSAREATYGDRLTYTLRITNASQSAEIVQAVVTDAPSAGLDYVPGSSALDGEALADPAATAGELRWNIARLPAGRTLTLTYAMRVGPGATGQLVNEVQVTGLGGSGGVARAIASNMATADTRLRPLQFDARGDLVGRVYVDRNRNGVYDPELDTPLERARVLLAGGRQAVTDQQGRYSFLSVPDGAHALRLDPASAPYPALARPEDGGLGGTRTVQVRGLTSVEFPLAPLGGSASALRRTTLLLGDVRLDKVVLGEGEGVYQVTLTLTTPRELRGAVLTDALPDGAVLKEGRNIHIGTFTPGEHVLTYRFVWTGGAGGATTDPDLRWER